MTNAEYIIGALMDFVATTERIDRGVEIPTFDDDGATEEAVIHYHIQCPMGFNCELCIDRKKSPTRDLCVECKMDWLLQDVEA